MKKKTKKTGICRRDIIKPEVKDKATGKVLEKGVYGQLSISDGDIRSAIKNALRRLWNSSGQRVFLEEVRYKAVKSVQLKHRVKEVEYWAVRCNECELEMGISEKEYTIKKGGKQSKKKKAVFDVDHLTGSPGFEDIEADLGAWTHNLFYGQLRILCKPCHCDRTEKQRKEGK